jgi:hypothetical protein
MRKLTLVLVMAVATLATFAQGNILVIGVVTDKETNQPLSMAAIQIKNTQLGALSEDNGYFEMPLPVSNLKDSIRVSYVGYTPVSLSIADYKTGDTLRIALGMDNMIKGEVVITALGARAVMLKAIENMKKNFYYDSLISTGLYRQYHKENGKYVRLMEADVSVAFNVKSPYKYSFHELVRVNKQRRSDNYETNGDVHGDHLVDLLKQNAYSYNRASFLDAKKIDFYAPKMLSENEKEYVITLQYKEANSATLENAKLVIEKETFAITRMEIEKYPNPVYVRSRYSNESRWQLVNEKDVIETTKQNGKYMVSSIVRSYNHHVLNPRTKAVDFIVEESFELFFDDYETSDVGARISKEGNYNSMTDLYTTKYGYSTKFWDNYNLLDEYPTPAQVVKDLDAKKPLVQQFKEMGL